MNSSVNPRPGQSFESFAAVGSARVAETPRPTVSVFRLALLNQYNLILLAGAALFSIALANPLPAMIAAGAEFLFLTIGISTPPVRRWAQRQVEAKHAAAVALRARHQQQGLDPFYAGRVTALSELGQVIRGMVIERGFSRSLSGDGDRLSELLRAFTLLATQHQRLSRILTETPTGPIAAQVTGIEGALAQERDETVRLTLSRALALGHRRLKQQIRTESQRRAIGVKLKTVEMSFDYLRSHILAGGSEADLHEEIDQVLATTAWSPLLDGELVGEGSVSRSVPGAFVTHESRRDGVSSAKLAVPQTGTSGPKLAASQTGTSGPKLAVSQTGSGMKAVAALPMSEAVTPPPAAATAGKFRRP